MTIDLIRQNFNLAMRPESVRPEGLDEYPLLKRAIDRVDVLRNRFFQSCFLMGLSGIMARLTSNNELLRNFVCPSLFYAATSAAGTWFVRLDTATKLLREIGNLDTPSLQNEPPNPAEERAALARIAKARNKLVGNCILLGATYGISCLNYQSLHPYFIPLLTVVGTNLSAQFIQELCEAVSDLELSRDPLLDSGIFQFRQARRALDARFRV